jgi:hypothetical protein
MADELSRLRLTPQTLHDLAMMEPDQYEGLSAETRARLFSALVVTCSDLFDALMRIDRAVRTGLDPR